MRCSTQSKRAARLAVRASGMEGKFVGRDMKGAGWPQGQALVSVGQLIGPSKHLGRIRGQLTSGGVGKTIPRVTLAVAGRAGDDERFVSWVWCSTAP